MEHPYEHRAHYNERGEICHCPWGIAPGNEHLGSLKIVEASKLEWLEDRPDMQSERNRRWLNFMKKGELAHESTDKLLPWLHREFKKNRLMPALDGASQALAFLPEGGSYNPNEPLDYVTKPQTKFLGPHDLRDLQEDLDEMQKRRQGVDLMRHTVQDLMPKVEDFRKWKGQQKRKDYGEVLHKFPNGWTMRRLQNDREHRDEGDRMHHCVGQPQYGYSENTEKARKIYASLRDEMNEPHATLEITPDHWVHKDTGEESQMPGEGFIPQIGEHSDIEQFFGPNDSDPEYEHRRMVDEWLEAHGAQPTDPYANEAEEVDVGPAHDMDSYLGVHGEDGDWLEYVDETDAEGRPRGENTEFNFLPPDVHSVADDLLNYGHETPESFRSVFDTARSRMEIAPGQFRGPSLEDAMRRRYEEGNPDHEWAMKEWERLKEPYYHPYTGEFVEGEQGTPIEQYQRPLFEKNPRYPIQSLSPEYKRDDQGYIMRDESGQPIMEPVYGPQPDYYRYAARSLPLYHRWVFSPSSGVTIGSNREDHPAFVKYHQGLAGDVNATDLVHGYAYPIGNGWRVTDYEHKALEDPYIVNQVVRALNHNGAPLGTAEASWRPAEYDWDRLHFAIPQELKR